MLMPALSVTVIGIVVAAAGIAKGNPARRMVAHGLVGAWLGFGLGAVPGVAFDVIFTSGAYIALLGHLGAAAGAIGAVWRASGTATTGRAVEREP